MPSIAISSVHTLNIYLDANTKFSGNLRRVHTTYDMSCDQSRCRVDMSRTVFFCRSTCQADRHSVGFHQRMSIDRLQCGRMSVDIDGVELDKHGKNLVAFYFDNNKFSV